MDKLFNWVSVVVGIFGGVFAWAFGAWDKLLCALITLIILDYITGLLKGWYTKRLSSEIGFKGIAKKIVILIMVVTANVLQTVIGDKIMLREIVIMFFIANEGLSLLENCAEINGGGGIPPKLKAVLLQLRGKCEDEDEDEEEEPEDSDDDTEEDTEEKDGEENVDDTEKSDGDKPDSESE